MIDGWICVRAKDGAILTKRGHWVVNPETAFAVKIYETSEKAGTYGLERIEECDGKITDRGIVELGRAIRIDLTKGILEQCKEHSDRVLCSL